MATPIQITIDCADSRVLERFWATALYYVSPDPPEGFGRWSDYWRSFDLPEEEIDDTASSVVDPDGIGPRIFFQPVPEGKVVKNRVHLDLTVSGGRGVPLEDRMARIDAEADRLVTAGATRRQVISEGGHYAIAMHDPEGNEFDLN